MIRLIRDKSLSSGWPITSVEFAFKYVLFKFSLSYESP